MKANNLIVFLLTMLPSLTFGVNPSAGLDDFADKTGDHARGFDRRISSGEQAANIYDEVKFRLEKLDEDLKGRRRWSSEQRRAFFEEFAITLRLARSLRSESHDFEYPIGEILKALKGDQLESEAEILNDFEQQRRFLQPGK